MIIYNPTSGLPIEGIIKSNPKKCFLITPLDTKNQEVAEIRNQIEHVCKERDYGVLDALSSIDGKDFLIKIWKQIASVPLCIAIYHHDIQNKTQCNIFYELGVAQALGKETIIVKTKEAEIPSDFVRTEHIEYNQNFKDKLVKYFASLGELAKYYEIMADNTENNPILSIDFLRRTFLITGDEKLKDKAKCILKESKLEEIRAKNSIELLLAKF